MATTRTAPAKVPAKAAKTTKSTAVATADVQSRVAEMIAGLQDRIGKPSGDRIVCNRDKEFELPDGRKSDEPINLIILDFVAANAYYEGKYDPKNPVPPVCASVGKVINNMVPFKSAPEPQNDKCATCPNNQFGSDGNGKACKNTRLLAVLPADFDEDTPIYTLSVSPTGIKHFDKFANSLASAKRMMPFQVVTQVAFDPASDYPTLLFKPLDVVPVEQLEAILAKLDEAEQRLLVEPDFTPREAAKPAGKKTTARRTVRA